MDDIIRNARIASKPDSALPTVGVDFGKTVAIEPSLAPTEREIGAASRSISHVVVQSHTSLDRSRIVDRHRARERTIENIVIEVAKAMFVVPGCRDGAFVIANNA